MTIQATFAQAPRGGGGSTQVEPASALERWNALCAVESNAVRTKERCTAQQTPPPSDVHPRADAGPASAHMLHSTQNQAPSKNQWHSAGQRRKQQRLGVDLRNRITWGQLQCVGTEVSKLTSYKNRRSTGESTARTALTLRRLG